MNRYILLLVFNGLLSAFSQVLLKKSAKNNYKNFISQYLNIYVILGYLMFFVVLMLNIYVMKYINLNIINVFSESLPYILSIISGYLFFEEKISKNKIIGSISILLGVILVVL